MLTIGLTGGIGSGKSTVASMFAKLGVPIYKADDQAKLLQNQEPLRNQIQQIFDIPVYHNNQLNRKLVASLVFNNNELLQKLNSLVHPAVSLHFKAWYSNQKAAYIIKEAAIIFEIAAEKDYDKIVLITAPETLRIERVMQRDGMTKNEVQVRIKNQMSDAQKRLLCDFEIENIDLEKTELAVKSLHLRLLKLVKSNN